MLRAINSDPSPGPSITAEAPVEYPSNAALTPALRATLQKTYAAQYDERKGAWGFDYKYLDADYLEYSIMLAQGGDTAAGRRARQTLGAQLALLDPVWGGMYQYSTGGDWKEPHFEKILNIQTQNLRMYVLGYEQWGDPVYLKTAERIHDFLRDFLLSPDHGFYTSQDADVVAGRHSAAYFRLTDDARRKQ